MKYPDYILIFFKLHIYDLCHEDILISCNKYIHYITYDWVISMCIIKYDE